MFKIKTVQVLAVIFIFTMFFSVSCSKNVSDPTPSPTPTPPPVYVDDFTDGDLNNSVSAVTTNNWYATGSSGGSHTGPSISTSDVGSACLAITGTAQAHYGTTIYGGNIVIGTFLMASDTDYLNAFNQTNIKLRVKFEVISAGTGSLSYEIRLSDKDGNALKYVLTPTTGTWQTLTLNFADFEILGGITVTREQILSSLGDMSITINYYSAVLDETADVAVFLDDVSLDSR